MTSIEERKQRWNDFYRPDGDTKVLFQINYNVPGAPLCPPLQPQRKAERIEWAWQSWLQAMERSTWLEDDYLPHLHVFAGTEIFAEAFGCRVHQSASIFPSAVPLVNSPQEAAKLKQPRLEDSPLTLLFDIADELKKRAGADALLRIPYIECPMDIVAMIWNKSALFLSLLDEPECVKELSAKIMGLLTEFLDEWFRRYGTEYIGHHPHYYMNGGLSVTVDEIGSISDAMYREFFEDDLRALSQRYGGLGVHCCANSRHQWKNLRRLPGLRLLNLVRPEKVLRESYEYFRDTAAMWPEKMEGGIPEPMSNPKMAELPAGSRILFTENAFSREEALHLSEQLHKEYR